MELLENLPARQEATVRSRKGRVVMCAARTLKDHARGHAHRGRDVVVDHAHEVHEVRARLGRAHARHDLLPVGAREQVGRQRRRHVRGHGRGAAWAAAAHVGRLQPVDGGHHLGLERKVLRDGGVVLGGGRGLHGARLGVEEEVGRVEVLRALRLGDGLRHEHLARAHDLRLQRELLERRDEGGRLEDRGYGRADVARGVGLAAEEDLGREVLLVDRVGVGREDAVLPAVVGLAHVDEGELALAHVGHDGHEVDRRARGARGRAQLLVRVGRDRPLLRAHLRLVGRVLAPVLVALRRGAHLALRGHRLALDEVAKGRRRLLLERNDHEAKLQEVVDDVLGERHPHVVQVAREGVLERHVAPVAAHDAARAEQLAQQNGARRLDRGRGVVQVVERVEHVVGDLDLAGRAGVDGRERARVLLALDEVAKG
ncbi:MAG: hypothetical protein CL844_05525, partial [Crocinitomicaceae bacterium]|nr:hypothetical protein [Crocinitomicaceae bacterium]